MFLIYFCPQNNHKMKKTGLLITGATGNIGTSVIKHIFETNPDANVLAGVRNIEKAKSGYKDYPDLQFAHFDFEDPGTFEPALEKAEMVFLLRPPHIADVKKYFPPLFKKMKELGVNKVVFLSVQGADKSSVIPHNKIEKMIIGYGFDHVFLRPGYFMQNLTTTLHKDIIEKHQIILPAGNAKFNWIDVEDIGLAAALIMKDFYRYANQAFDITGSENKTFSEVTAEISKITGKRITFRNVSPFKFIAIKRKEGLKTGYIMVMIMLHFLPRFQKEPEISSFIHKLLGRKPYTLGGFIEREKEMFTR